VSSCLRPCLIGDSGATLDAGMRPANKRSKRKIIRALEREVTQRTGWSPNFLEQLAKVDREVADAADEALLTIRAARRSKTPQRP
jgi:hypothetical protein